MFVECPAGGRLDPRMLGDKIPGVELLKLSEGLGPLTTAYTSRDVGLPDLSLLDFCS